MEAASCPDARPRRARRRIRTNSAPQCVTATWMKSRLRESRCAILTYGTFAQVDWDPARGALSILLTSAVHVKRRPQPVTCSGSSTSIHTRASRRSRYSHADFPFLQVHFQERRRPDLTYRCIESWVVMRRSMTKDLQQVDVDDGRF